MLDLFSPVKSVSADKVREVIATKAPSEYCLIDVRQQEEYAEGHLPGARLFPLGELSSSLGGPSKLDSLDKDRETYLYCRSGNRSRSATSLLESAGFTKAINMQGGIDQWNGITASGEPEFGKFCFPSTLKAPELAAVAWLLEDGTQRFYRGVLEHCKSVCGVLENLARAEDSHKQTLKALYEELSGQPAGKDFPRDVVTSPLEMADEDMMEGCVPVQKALDWARGKEVRDILELMMALEANALDLYLKMARGVSEEGAIRVFTSLSKEEQAHLDALGSELSSLPPA